MAWPIQVARKAPAMPSTVVRMNPLGLLGPGESMRARIPATKPITMIQMIPPMAFTSFAEREASDRHFVRTGQATMRRQSIDHLGQVLAQAIEQFIPRQAGLGGQRADLVGAERAAEIAG